MLGRGLRVQARLIRMAYGGGVLGQGRALGGVRGVWFDSDAGNRARREKERIDWDNPGDRLGAVPDEIVYALPPPSRPAYPYTDEELRAKEMRSRIPLALLVLAALLHIAYTTVNRRKNVRAELERAAPSLASLLRSMHLLQDYPHSHELDREELFGRIFRRYGLSDGVLRRGRTEVDGCTIAAAADEEVEGGGIDVREVVDLALLLRGERRYRVGALGGEGVEEGGREGGEGVEWVRRVVGEVLGDGKKWVEKEDFLRVMERVCEGVEDERLFLEAGEGCGVWGVDMESADGFAKLHDHIVSENGGSLLCTVPFLTAVAEEAGFVGDEEKAREHLTESKAVQLGWIALHPWDWTIREPPSLTLQRKKALGEMTPQQLAHAAALVAKEQKDAGMEVGLATNWDDVQNGQEREDGGGEDGALDDVVEGEKDKVRKLRQQSRLLVRSHVKIPFTKSEFINYMTDVSKTMTPKEIKSCLDVFFLLASVKGAAHVPPTTIHNRKQKAGAE